MAVVLLLLSMCVIQMTSSQSTYDVTQQNDVISCERTEHTYSQLIASLKELQRDVAELKAANQPAVAKSVECPANFTHIASVNGCYKLVTRNLEWSVAGLECRRLHKDAHLVVINDAEENLAVTGMLASTSQTTVSGCYKHINWGLTFWTAGQRIDPSRCSTFIWRVTSTNAYSETLSTMTYTNWYSGQPNCHSQQEKCMNLGGGRSYGWNDLSCSIEGCSVCELDM